MRIEIEVQDGTKKTVWITKKGVEAILDRFERLLDVEKVDAPCPLCQKHFHYDRHNSRCYKNGNVCPLGAKSRPQKCMYVMIGNRSVGGWCGWAQFQIYEWGVVRLTGFNHRRYKRFISELYKLYKSGGKK